MIVKRKPHWFVVLLLVLNSGLIACDGEEATDTPPPAEAMTVTITFFQEPDTLNPLYTGMWFTDITHEFWLSPLWYFDDELEMVPELAVQIPTVENGGLSEGATKLNIKLREGVTWSDGTPLTAHDYVFTYKMLMDDGNANIQSRYPYDPFVESVTALDDLALQIILNAPLASWASSLVLQPLPRHILEPVFEVEGSIDGADWNRIPFVSVGPFVLTEWVAASHLIFKANDNYWRGRPKLDQIFIRIVPDDQVQMAAIQTGDTDIGVLLAAANKPDIDALENIEMIGVPGGYIESWFFNLVDEELAHKTGIAPGHPALQDVRVRRAIVMGVDRQQIIDELFYGVYDIPAGYWFGTVYEDKSLQPLPYDPQKAMALLDEAGWVDSNGDGTRDKNGVELVLRYSTIAGDETREATQVVAQQMLADIGVGIEIQNYSTDVIWNSFGDGGPIALGEYDIAEWPDNPDDFPDPNTAEWLCDEIPSEEFPAGGNWQGVCIDDLDALFQAQAVTADPAARKQMFIEIQRIMHEQVFWMGLRTDTDLWSVNTRLKNIRLSGVDPFWNSFEWDISQ